jgi:hypothetical protein
MNAAQKALATVRCTSADAANLRRIPCVLKYQSFANEAGLASTCNLIPPRSQIVPMSSCRFPGDMQASPSKALVHQTVGRSGSGLLAAMYPASAPAQ